MLIIFRCKNVLFICHNFCFGVLGSYNYMSLSFDTLNLETTQNKSSEKLNIVKNFFQSRHPKMFTSKRDEQTQNPSISTTLIQHLLLIYNIKLIFFSQCHSICDMKITTILQLKLTRTVQAKHQFQTGLFQGFKLIQFNPRYK